MCISAVTLGELVFGAERSQQVERNLTDIEALVARLEVLPLDSKAAYHFGQIRSELYTIGQSIGPYDMLIAGHAREALFHSFQTNTTCIAVPFLLTYYPVFSIVDPEKSKILSSFAKINLLSSRLLI